MCKALGVDTLSYTQIHKDQKETRCKINDMPSPEVTLLHLNASGPCHRHHGPYSLMHTTPVCMIPESRAPVAQHIHPTINHGPYFPACVMANHGIYLQLHSIHVKSQPLSPQIRPHYSHRPFFPICTPHSSPHSPAQAHQCQPQLLSLSAGTPVQLVIPIPQHLPQQTPTATPCPNIQPNASHTSNIQPNASHSPIPQIIRPTAHQCP